MSERKHKIKLDRSLAIYKSRSEPHWETCGESRALGLRVGINSSAWVGRWTEPAKALGAKRPRYVIETLGKVSDDMPYSVAHARALKFFERCATEWKNRVSGDGVQIKAPVTVLDALDQYVAHLKVFKSEKASICARRTLAPVYKSEVVKINLCDLVRPHVRQLRDSLPTEKRSKQAANRVFRQFKAALNFTHENFETFIDVWSKVKRFPVKDGVRDIYFTVEQRRAILAAIERPITPEEKASAPKLAMYCTRELASFIRGLMFLGCRPGELAQVTVADLNLRTEKLRLISAKNNKGEATPREFPLFERAAMDFFREQARGKTPLAPLISRDGSAHWRIHQWARGLKFAIRLANKQLPAEARISSKAVAYCFRGTVATDLLEIHDVLKVAEMLGTSPKMLARHYRRDVESRLREKFSMRASF